MAANALSSSRECHDCGLIQQLPTLPDGMGAACARCGAELERSDRYSLNLARSCAVIASLSFMGALALPFVRLEVLGRVSTSNLLDCPRLLAAKGVPALAAVVLVTLVLMPSVKLVVQLAILFGALLPQPPRQLAWWFAWLDKITPWSMIEVFLLGTFVAYTRLREMAHVVIGPSIIALGGTMLAMVVIDATLDHEALWRALDRNAARRTSSDREALPYETNATSATEASDAAEGDVLGCDACRQVSRAAVGDPCDRCGHPLVRRKPQTVPRVWALVIASALLYIPANVLPVMSVVRLGRGGPTTILNGVEELFEAKLWPLAVLVLLASVVIPMFKLASLIYMLVSIQTHSARALRGRTKLFRVVHAIGRWSMLDIFMLATLVGVVQLGMISTVTPGLGAGAFCAVVILTMIATEMFDPRVMWDVAEQTGDGSLAQAAHAAQETG